jgi:hypothetical protein
VVSNRQFEGLLSRDNSSQERKARQEDPFVGSDDRKGKRQSASHDLAVEIITRGKMKMHCYYENWQRDSKVVESMQRNKKRDQNDNT